MSEPAFMANGVFRTGDKFRLAREIRGWPAGTIVEFGRGYLFSCDVFPVDENGVPLGHLYVNDPMSDLVKVRCDE